MTETAVRECPRCGLSAEEGDRWCVRCGERLVGAPAAATALPPPPPSGPSQAPHEAPASAPPPPPPPPAPQAAPAPSSAPAETAAAQHEQQPPPPPPAAPAPPPPPAPTQAQDQSPPRQDTLSAPNVDVVVVEIGPARADVADEVRALTGLPLSRAKGVLDSSGPILTAVPRQVAWDAKRRLEALGARVELR